MGKERKGRRERDPAFRYVVSMPEKKEKIQTNKTINMSIPCPREATKKKIFEGKCAKDIKAV